VPAAGLLNARGTWFQDDRGKGYGSWQLSFDLTAQTLSETMEKVTVAVYVCDELQLRV
jgi:hypothetical protein